MTSPRPVAEIKLQMERIAALVVLVGDESPRAVFGDPPEPIYRQWIPLLDEHLPCRVRLVSAATIGLPLDVGIYRACLTEDTVQGLRVQLTGKREGKYLLGATVYPSDFCRNVADGVIVDVEARR